MDKFDKDVLKRLERKKREQWFYGMISYDLEGYTPFVYCEKCFNPFKYNAKGCKVRINSGLNLCKNCNKGE